ncbi:DUF1707 domain-containing protein [Agromyces protaetiae]|uniref:DUF1707 domain-containing protein n=1 Tax=Agromyces protaetiae TaxID=2509455 RepID=A0A4P6FBV6_9MICO|nr:DUF1707 domain-containing protein [Agromyces protaetiae]QAY72403.1 DUF1707 domain-containing protein [Agromyces protaetiae]
MVDYANPLRPAERIANSDRDGAVDALARSRDEGRLTPAEFDQRAASARAAVTWGDLAPLFGDLPRGGNGAAGGAYAGAPGPAYEVGSPQGGGSWGSSRALGGAWGATIMAFVPFLALGLFFIAGFAWGGWAWSWLFFLLIPIAGVVIYGPASDRRGRY